MGYEKQPFQILHSKYFRNTIFPFFLQLFLWIFLLLIGLEFILRFFVSGVTPDIFFSPDFGPRPIEGSTIRFSREGYGIVNYSGFGEITTPYDDGFDIVVFGDSQTASYQVNDDQNFVSIAEEELRRKGKQVNLHNYGYPAGTLADYSYLASYTQKELNPKIVVIQISTNDFFGQNGKEGYVQSSIGNYFLKNPQGGLEVEHKPINNNNALYKKLSTKSALISHGIERLRLFRTVIGKNMISIQVPGDVNSIDTSNTQVFPDIGLVENYREQLEALHCAYKDQKVIIVYLPFAPLIKNDNVELENFESILLLQEIRKHPDWVIVDPTDEFQKLWLREQKLPRGFSNSEPGTGHLNIEGHAIVGNKLAEKISEVLQ